MEPNPQPDWMSDEDYAEYIIQFNFDSGLGNSYFQKKQQAADYTQRNVIKTAPAEEPPVALPPPTPVEPATLEEQLPTIGPQLGDPGFQVLLPGLTQFGEGTGIFKRLSTEQLDEAQFKEYQELVQDFVTAGEMSEQEVLNEVDARLTEAGYNPFAFDPDEQQEYFDARREALEEYEWAEKLAYETIYDPTRSPRRPRAASEFGAPATSMQPAGLRGKTPAEIEEMGTLEVMYEAAKPQVLETQSEREKRRVREGYLKTLEDIAIRDTNAGKYEDVDIARGQVYTDFFNDKQAQAAAQARSNYSQYTGKPVELATQEEVDMLAKAIYMQFLQNNFPDEYREEEKRPAERAAFGIEANQEGMFFKVWGDAIHRGFLTNQVDVTGIRGALEYVGVLEESDLITETMAGALVRDIGGIVRVPVNVVKEAVTYDVNPYTGEALDDSDIGFIAVEPMGRKEDAAWGKTIVLPNAGVFEDYFKTTAYEIATMRTLGDDIASMSAVPEDYETTVRVGGLVTELLIPIDPTKYARAARLPLTLTAKGLGKGFKVADTAIDLGRAQRGKTIATGTTPSTAVGRQAQIDELTTRMDSLVTTRNTKPVGSPEYKALDAEVDAIFTRKRTLERRMAAVEARGKKIDDVTTRAEQFIDSPLKESILIAKRRANLDKPLRAAGVAEDVDIDVLLRVNADEVLDANSYAMRYADNVGQFYEDLIDTALGLSTRGATRLADFGIDASKAGRLINTLAEQKGIAGRLGKTAQKEIQAFRGYAQGEETAEKLLKFRMEQALGDAPNPYVNAVKEQLADTFYADYVPLTTRLIVSKKAFKEMWPQLSEAIANARKSYLLPNPGDANKPMLLTQEGVEFLRARNANFSGPLGDLLRGSRGADLMLTEQQGIVVAEKLAEAIATDMLPRADILRPATGGVTTTRAFEPQGRRLFSEGIFEGTMIGAKTVIKAANDNVLIPIAKGFVEKVTKRKYQGFTNPPTQIWATNTVRGIEEGIGALDNGFFNAVSGLRAELKARGQAGKLDAAIFLKDEAGAELVFSYMFRHAARGGDPMDFARDAGKIVDELDNLAQPRITTEIPTASRPEYNQLLNRQRELREAIEASELDLRAAQLAAPDAAETIALEERIGQQLDELEDVVGRIQGIEASKVEREVYDLSTESGRLNIGLYEMLKYYIGPGIKTDTDLAVFNQKFREAFEIKTRVTPERMRTLTGMEASKSLELNPINMQSQLPPTEAFNSTRINAFIDSLPPTMRQSEVINQASLETFRFLGSAPADVETAIIQYIFGKSRDKVVERVIANEINRGGVGFITKSDLAQEVQLTSISQVDFVANAGHPLRNAVTLEELRAPRKIGDLEAARNPAVVINNAVNEFVQTTAGQQARAELIAATTQNIMKYGDIKPDEALFGAFDRFMNSVRNPAGRKLMDEIRDNASRTQNMERAAAARAGKEFTDFEFPKSPTDMFRGANADGIGATTPQLFDDVLREIVGSQPYSYTSGLQTGGIAAGYMNEAEFLQQVQAVLLRVGEKELTITDRYTRNLLTRLQSDYGALALQDNYSGFSASFYDVRRRDPTFMGKVLGDLGMIVRGLRRNIVSGQLAGKFLFPNVPYQAENILTAPLIASVTSPDYLNTIMRQQGRIGVGLMSMGTMKMTPDQMIRQAIRNGRGEEVFFTTRTGEAVTYRRAQNLLLENNTGRSQNALNLGETLVNDIKAAARTYSLNIPQGLPKTGRNYYVQLLDAALTGRTPSYAHWANGADQAMREAVFFNAIKDGVQVNEAAALARNVVLDYGKVPVWFRRQLGGMFLYTSFMYRMSAETLLSMFRSAKQAQQVSATPLKMGSTYNQKIDGIMRGFLNGTPQQNLVRAAVWKKYVHNNNGQWMFVNDTTKSTMWSYYMGEYDMTDAYMQGMRDPIISQVIMFGNFMDYIYQGTGYFGLTDAYQDKPFEQRTLEGLLDTFYSPTIDLLMDIKDARSGQRVPAKFVQMFRFMDTARPGTWGAIQQYCDIEPITDPEKMRPGEPIFAEPGTRGVQYRFRTQAGVQNYIKIGYLMQITSTQRIGSDITGMLMAMDAIPDGSYFFRYSADAPLPEGVQERDSDGNSLLDGAAYMIIRNRPVRVPKEWEAYDRVLRTNKAKLQLKGKRGR